MTSVKLTKTEIAVVKGINSSLAPLRRKASKLDEKIKELQAERDGYLAQIDAIEEPIRKTTGGLSPQEFLDSLEMTETVEAVAENAVATEVVEVEF
jgi:phage shock protein A